MTTKTPFNVVLQPLDIYVFEDDILFEILISECEPISRRWKTSRRMSGDFPHNQIHCPGIRKHALQNRTTKFSCAFRNRSLYSISNASTFISWDQILFTNHRNTHAPHGKFRSYDWILGSNNISIYISISWKATDQFLIGFCAIIYHVLGIHFLQWHISNEFKREFMRCDSIDVKNEVKPHYIISERNESMDENVRIMMKREWCSGKCVNRMEMPLLPHSIELEYLIVDIE